MKMTKTQLQRAVAGALEEAGRGMAQFYWEHVERVATELRGQFERGEFRGRLDADDATGTDDPLMLLQDEMCRRLFTDQIEHLCDLGGKDFGARRLAMWVLLCSPHAAAEYGVSTDSPEWQAADAFALDVLHFAREAGWSVPQPGEKPAFVKASQSGRAA